MIYLVNVYYFYFLQGLFRCIADVLQKMIDCREGLSIHVV